MTAITTNPAEQLLAQYGEDVPEFSGEELDLVCAYLEERGLRSVGGYCPKRS